MSKNEDGSNILTSNQRTMSLQIKKQSNHISDLDKRISRLEKLVIAAIATNLPQLLQIIFGL